MNGSHHVSTTPFVVGKDEWDTMEDTGKSMHCIHSGMAKGTSWAEAMSNSEKNQASSLRHCRVILA